MKDVFIKSTQIALQTTGYVEAVRNVHLEIVGMTHQDGFE